MDIQLPLTDKSLVGDMIPQKKPFVMVDSLVAFSDTALESAFSVPEDHVFTFDGTFQAPGVLEHQAQSVALHTGYQYYIKNEVPPVGYIGAIKYFEISRLPKVGERIETSVSVIDELMGVTLVQIISKILGEEIAKSEMKTVIK